MSHHYRMCSKSYNCIPVFLCTSRETSIPHLHKGLFIVFLLYVNSQWSCSILYFVFMNSSTSTSLVLVLVNMKIQWWVMIFTQSAIVLLKEIFASMNPRIHSLYFGFFYPSMWQSLFSPSSILQATTWWDIYLQFKLYFISYLWKKSVWRLWQSNVSFPMTLKQ